MENKNWTKRIVLALTVMVTLTGLYATVGKHRMKEYQACKIGINSIVK